MVLIFASEFGTPLEILEHKQSELNRQLRLEYHPTAIHGLLDQLDEVNQKIRAEKRKYSQRRF